MIPISKQIQVDDENDVVTICGIRYAGHLFRCFGLESELKPGQTFRIVERNDGVITINVTRDESAP